jgi:two-component system response regulator HydG
VQPVGGHQVHKVDIRLVAATNRDLKAMVVEGSFREDLLYRLQVVTVVCPPLRERKGDIPLLVDHFLSEFGKQHGRGVRGLAPEARSALLRYDWPGNVRELRNTIESMVLLARSSTLGIEDVPETIRAGAAAGHARGGADLAGRSLAEVERDLIRENLKAFGGNRERTAKVLGIGERTLYRKIKEYGL